MKDLNQSYAETVKIGLAHREVFDWPNSLEVLKKVEEELRELKEAMQVKSQKEIFEESSDVIFTMVQCLRHLNLELPELLDFANEKFSLRFSKMTELILADHKNLKDLNLDEAESYWSKAKKNTESELLQLLESRAKNTEHRA